MRVIIINEFQDKSRNNLTIILHLIMLYLIFCSMFTYYIIGTEVHLSVTPVEEEDQMEVTGLLFC